ncbi:efflux transporter outer membrane subunit [Herbaspirillum sp. RTI4]|uniref:efflux transporter outer membrane subunit n=1 Tax=Herbaspirillum sp. RTI4 TaxID=3048640 RepID=UPI002AB409C8|nr:efflux transporter outer membrane subunit [Herbaspirillum sp. RTI4]MDY7578391.1 efflux transporter outer membrane subunit [Herbaspirillum sp. RTI4]MEA9983068.1 efflux transporter outer membrane subunit [Herbaspirillum sp. RTI4]
MTMPTDKRALAAFPILVLCLAIAGCADTGGIAPQARLQPANTLDVGNAIRQVGAEAGWPTRAWWEKYADPQLNRLIAAAIADNPGMAVAAARVRQAQSMATATHAGEMPQASLEASMGRKNWSGNPYYGGGAYASTDTWNNTAQLNLSYDPDLWGQRRDATARAEDELRAVAADGRSAQLDLEANVLRAYVTLSLEYGLLDSTSAMLEHEQQIVSLAQRRLQGGLGTQMEISQAQVPLPETRRQMEALQENIALARNQLAALIGQGPGAGDSITRPTLQLDVAFGLPSVLPAELIGRRPDISAARWRIEAATQNIGIAKAAFYPNINLLAGIGPMAAGGGMLSFLTASNVSTTFGPAISLPIFDGGRLRGQLGVAAAGYDIDVEHYKQLLTGALKSIADQVVTLRSLQLQKQDAELSVSTARSNLDNATHAYQRGLTGYLNVLTAQTQLLRQQQITQQLQARRFTAYATLATALGGGFELAQSEPIPPSAQGEVR